MSAQAQQQHYFQPVPSFLELDATRAISREAAHATLPAAGLAAIAQAVLKIPGASAVQLCRVADSAVSNELGLRDLSLTGHKIHSGTRASAIGPVASSGVAWGELRIEFDIPSFEVETPVRFVTYVAQQIAGMLQRIYLREKQWALEQAVSRFRRSLATRKTVHRAAGILARAYELSERDAIAMLMQQSRDLSRPVDGIAQQIIASHRVVPGVSARR
jgi:hypothetical protein